LSANFRWKGTSPPNYCWCQKTRVILLPRNENHVILSSFVWIGYQRVTDRQTDGQTDGRNCRRYYSALHCKQCGRAVKFVISPWCGLCTYNAICTVTGSARPSDSSSILTNELSWFLLLKHQQKRTQ